MSTVITNFAGDLADDEHVVLESDYDSKCFDLEAALSQLAALREELATQDRVLRSSVPDEHKSCTSPVGAVQNHIGDLEQRLADAERRNSDYLSLLRASRNCHNSPGVGNKDAWVYHRIDGRINEALSAANGAGYQSREIGESDWSDCDKSEYDRCAKDPHMDTRIKLEEAKS